MKIVYFGTAEFAVPILQAIAPHVALVVAQPDRPSKRGLRLEPSPVKAAALALGLAVETPDRARNPEFIASIRDLRADALIVAAYGQILPEQLLESARQGAFNLHGSILPKYRGAAPIQRCIQAGETETGVTLMQMDKGMDTGDIIAIERLAIGAEETYGALQGRLATLAAEMTSAWLPRLVAGDYPRSPQDHVAATHAPKVEKAEARLDFDSAVILEHRKYRAFTPSPGATLQTRWGTVRVESARLDERQGVPGTMSGPASVAFVGGSLELVEVRPEGKKRMSGRDFANGFRLQPGDSLR